MQRASAYAEIKMILSHMETAANQPLRWRPGARNAAAPHVRRYLTEAVGQALTNDLARNYGWDPLVHSMGWFDDPSDDLPPGARHLKPVGSGTRPDIVVETTSGWHAFESRGRSASAPTRNIPNSSESKRLGQLNGWANAAASRGPGCAWSMVYSWIDTTSVTVDLFDPGEPLQLNREDRAVAQDRLSRLIQEIGGDVRNQPGSSPVIIQVGESSFRGSITPVADRTRGGVSHFGALLRTSQSPRDADSDSAVGVQLSEVVDNTLDLLAVDDLILFTVRSDDRATDGAIEQLALGISSP